MRQPRALAMIVAAACALGGSGGLQAAAAATPSPGELVRPPAGALQGVVDDGAAAWLGVPYVRPPVGDLRWRAPQPLPPWQGVRTAARFGNDCMQGRRGAPGAQRPMSEDCLFLNIWAPATPRRRKLPVIVWVHGGAFMVGSAGQPLYDGARLARAGAVIVTFNYRLGKFGFLAHPALTRENPQGPLGNYGLLDVLAVLGWVKQNIAAFGGNPRNLTLAGQSAGGAAVEDLLTSPLAKGLFAKAIIESGVLTTAQPSFAEAQARGAAAAQTWDAAATDAAALRRLTAEQVQGDGPPLAGDWGPMVDGKVLPENVDQAFDEGQLLQVPLLIGSNSYEAGFFSGAVRGLSQRLASAWPRITALFDGYGTQRTALIEAQLGTDMMVTVPTRAAARDASRAGLPTYLYYYSYVRPAQRDQVPGASHMDEVYALFDHMSLMPRGRGGDSRAPASGTQPAGTQPAGTQPAGTQPAPATADIVAEVQSRWLQFARTGRPTKDRRNWPPFVPTDERLLEFTDAGVAVREDFEKQQLDLAAAIPAGFIDARPSVATAAAPATDPAATAPAATPPASSAPARRP